MKLSIITPCSRVHNLPTILNTISYNSNVFESIDWIIIHYGTVTDDRILLYEKPDNINIIQDVYNRESNDPYAGFMRNKGLTYANGNFIYYLDDDNIIHPKLYDTIVSVAEPDKLLILNQFNEKMNARLKSKFVISRIVPGYLDTAQIVVPIKFKHVLWPNGQMINGKICYLYKDGVQYNDECPYILDIIKEYGDNCIKWYNQLYTYRNYLRK